jgi:hypothetical protein
VDAFIKSTVFGCVILAIAAVVYSRIPSVCTSHDMAYKSARGAVMALLRSPGLAKFHEEAEVSGLGSEHVQVSGVVDTNEPSRTTERKRFHVKMSCASQQYMQVLEAHLSEHDTAPRERPVSDG